MPAMAQSGNTWRADYYNNPDWAGAPVATEFASFLSFDWGYGSPSPAVPVDNFTARFTTDAFFYAGNYNFSLIADDEIVLLMDGVPYQGIHQSHCFVSDGAWDSPNLGSIQMEPQIQSWVNCKPADQISTFYLSPEVPMKGYKCSRTMAGWFPN